MKTRIAISILWLVALSACSVQPTPSHQEVEATATFVRISTERAQMAIEKEKALQELEIQRARAALEATTKREEVVAAYEIENIKLYGFAQRAFVVVIGSISTIVVLWLLAQLARAVGHGAMLRSGLVWRDGSGRTPVIASKVAGGLQFTDLSKTEPATIYIQTDGGIDNLVRTLRGGARLAPLVSAPELTTGERQHELSLGSQLIELTASSGSDSGRHAAGKAVATFVGRSLPQPVILPAEEVQEFLQAAAKSGQLN